MSPIVMDSSRSMNMPEDMGVPDFGPGPLVDSEAMDADESVQALPDLAFQEDANLQDAAPIDGFDADMGEEDPYDSGMEEADATLFSEECIVLCTDWADCSLQSAECPGIGIIDSRNEFYSSCLPLCEGNPALRQLVDATDCDSTVSTIRGLQEDYDETCNDLQNLPEGVPCNGQDDDFDGMIDEHIAQPPSPCLSGEGQCQFPGSIQCIDGFLMCIPTVGTLDDYAPSVELCQNSIDEDCDGVVDESPGEQPCRPTVPVEEACNLLSNCALLSDTCDSIDDENSRTIFAERCPQIFAVHRRALQTIDRAWSCDQLVLTLSETNPEFGQYCTGELIELCDNRDNDFDGQIDEGIVLEPCFLGIGECRHEGISQCFRGFEMCRPNLGMEPHPIDEICGNNLDDDCDGQIDEGC
ncbi:MAG: hypothetical protein ACE366_18380 [Bradymonadia bacterium]